MSNIKKHKSFKFKQNGSEGAVKHKDLSPAAVYPVLKNALTIEEQNTIRSYYKK